VPKNSQPSDVALIVHKAVKKLEAEATVDAYEQNLFQQTLGDTPAMRRVIELVTKVSPTDSTVLLLGESGTGKEVLANMIHRLSPRRDNAFIAINCAALPEQLLESELFGHVKGAFTGAVADKRGLFEEADGGTIFLDEVGDTVPAVQAKLLRVLQNGEFRRVGDSLDQRVDARVLAATNLNLVEAVAEKAFREDLYFRLNVIQILIPPLRERLDALPALAEQFLLRFNQKFSRDIRNIDEQAWGLLQSYEYPGNVRELESIVAHAVIMGEGDTIRAVDLPDQVRFGRSARLVLPNPPPDSIPTLQEAEKRLIEMALERLDGNQTEVAKKMGISRSTLWRKIKEYDISRTGVAEKTDMED
jgi:transcriptional regulator with PAS, ATPase and Fis domain